MNLNDTDNGIHRHFQNMQKNFTSTADDNAQQDWSRFSEWMQCMCVVTFDLNLGQALEYVYPPQFTPTEQEISNICYMAFPDSNSGCMGDTKFHMRLRSITSNATTTTEHGNTASNNVRAYNRECVPVVRSDESHFWGFVYFRQRRDADLPRGYFQKSFIIITRLPFFNLFNEIVTFLATKYFNEGNAILEQACQQINTLWPKLQAGCTLNLPLFGYTYQIQIPSASTRKIANESRREFDISNPIVENYELTKVIQSVYEVDLFHSLNFIMDHLYTLWELVLTAEPVVVFGTSPADCSHMVQTLVSLIAPLDFCAEVRPYFTIHDTEFKEFTRECGKQPPSLILGVTNPFFIKLLKDWPHMLRLVDNQLNITQQQLFHKNVRSSSSVTSFSSSDLNSGGSAFKKNGGGSSLNVTLANSSNILSGDGSVPGLYTKYKPFLKKDKTLIKKVMLGMKTKRPGHVQTALIKRHLLELTQSFMIPLERYMASLMPLQKDISPFKSAPNANSFKLDDFLATLEQSGPHLTSPLKGDWRGLYRRFFSSPNFRGWYESRHRELQLTLQDLQLQALSAANLEQWARDKQEVEIIDMILKLKQKLSIYTDDAASSPTSPATSNGNNGTSNSSPLSTCDQIRAQIDCMKALLPHDLKNVVNI